MERMKRAVSLLLCFVMVFGLLPVYAFAAEGETEPANDATEVSTTAETEAANDATDASDAAETEAASDTYEVTAAANDSVSGTGNLVGNATYTIDTNGVDAGEKYLILNTRGNGNGYALTNNNGTVGSTTVQIAGNNNNSRTITVSDDSMIAWVFSGSTSGTVSNNGRYLYPNQNSLSLNENGTNLNVEGPSNGAYQIYRSTGTGWNSDEYYLRYNSGWTGNDEARNVYLYRLTSSSSGEEVTFTVTPGSGSLKPDDTLVLNGTVTVAGETVDLNDCTITWASADTSKATVSDGTVTGVADGNADITATLSAVNGTALQENIVLHVGVTVKSKEVTSAELTGNDPVTTKQNVEPDFSNIKLTVVYEDGTSAVITTANGLVIEGYDISTIGYSYATISYAGVEYGTVRVTVEGNPYEGKEDATSYPEYPADGAVRIDKSANELEFDTTGLVQVELDVAGVSVKQGVDVVLIVDVSNSMGWSLENSAMNYTNDYQKRAYGDQRTKLEIAMESASNFADIILEGNSGVSSDNTLSFVTFAGYDAEFGKDSTDTGKADSLMEVFQRETSAGDAKISFEGTYFNKRTSASDTDGDYLLTVTDNNGTVIVNAVSNRGDTNYDYAFWQATQTVNAIKAYNEANGQSGREVFIVFMTDGAPSHYNNATRNGSDGRSDLIPESEDQYYNESSSYNQVGWYEYFSTNANTYGKELYTLVNGNFMAIGFDLDHGGFSTWSWSEDELVTALKQVAHDTNEIQVQATADEAVLKNIFSAVANKIKYAGTNANATDIIDNDFTLQMSNTTGTVGEGVGQVDIAAKGYTPEITIKTYDLWTKDETTDTTLIGTRKGTYQEIETVTFNADGTEAYSNLIEGNILNKASDDTVTIEAHYFTYTKTPEGVESFSWRIGNITDKEIALSFMAYLKGSLEGEQANGLKYTNESATLEYLDINGKHATKTFPVPAVAWGGASTAYEFYLVNEDGQPCDRDGNVIPFANRIIITGPYYEELYLNQDDENNAKDIIAAYVLPAGYTLYDETAMYTVQTASGDNTGFLRVSAPGYGTIGVDENYTGTRYNKVENEDGTVSYVENENGSYKKITAQTTIIIKPTDLENETHFIQTHVAFGVKYNEIPDEADFQLTPDQVVIDYGKEITINIANGNDDLEDGYTATLVGFSKYYADVDMKQKFSNTPYADNYKATYGTFSIENNGEDDTESTVRYTPTSIINDVEMIFCVIEMYNEDKNDTYYMVDWLTVIPATIVYYETDFATGVFTSSTTSTSETDIWQEKSDTDLVSETSEDADDNTQNDGTIGYNTYGYDSTYSDDAYLSDGDSWFVKGQGYDNADNNYAAKTYVTFSFKGTGFDLISRTGAQQGLIKVEIFSDEAMTQSVKTVSVLNKSESNLELYQIPVVSVNKLTYGTYYVKISVNVAYENAIFPALNRGNEFYFDAIRVYDPAEGNEIAEAAYNADGEANNEIDEVREELISAQTFDELNPGVSANGMVFVDRIYNDDVADNEQGGVNVTDYKAIGPNNEVYLEKGQAVAFKMKTSLIPASFDVGAKSIQGDTALLEVTVTTGISGTSWIVDQEISSSTVQYINLLTKDSITTVFADEVYVVITNTGDGILSITDIKTAYKITDTVDLASSQQTLKLSAMPVANTSSVNTNGVATASEEVAEVYSPYAVTYTVDADTLEVARVVLTTSEEEEEIPEETEPVEPSEPETEPVEPSEPETEPTEPSEPEVSEPSEPTEPSEPEVSEPTEPEVTEPEEEPANYDILRASVTASGSLFNRKYTITAVTTQDVAEVKVSQMNWNVKTLSNDYVDMEDGTRVWTIVISARASLLIGIYRVIGYGVDGTSGTPAIVSIFR